jgi:predicted house-cleaning noncanonical NTP pyrophosphatase (MazG superfamily)
MNYHKLVRDRIPEIIGARGATAITHVADAEEYRLKLREKLQEEVAEFLADEAAGEIADIQEVLFALADDLGISKEELETIRLKKVEERGAFREKIILDETREND